MGLFFNSTFFVSLCNKIETEMNIITKYTVFALLMVAAIIFSVHEMFFLGTGFLLISAVFAVVFLHDDGDDDGFYKLT